MSIIGDRRNKEVAEKRAKENELLKVSIKKEDVDLIVSWIFFPWVESRLRIDNWTLEVSSSCLKVTECLLFDGSKVQEMEISKTVAERTLRMHHGNVVEALVSLTNWWRRYAEPVFIFANRHFQSCHCTYVRDYYKTFSTCVKAVYIFLFPIFWNKCGWLTWFFLQLMHTARFKAPIFVRTA